MTVQPIEATYPAADGLPLFERRWLPDGPPRAEILIVHGFVEHGGRYRASAETLTNRGFAVSVTDLRGHGRSGGPRCYVRQFADYLVDLDYTFARVRKRLGERPLFLLGHSLGGLIAAHWCARRQPPISGMVLSGPALDLSDRIFPWVRHLAAVGSLLFPRLRLVRMGCRHISRDEAVVRQFPRTRSFSTIGFPCAPGRRSCATQTAHTRFEEIRVPLLILHGTADCVATVDGSRRLYEQTKSGDKQLQLYPGLYHEVLNEPEREQVLADLTEWVEKRAG